MLSLQIGWNHRSS